MSARTIILLVACCNLAIAVAARGDDDIVDRDKQIAFFESNVRPLLLDRCAECHSGEEPESGLSVESREDLLAGGELGRAIVPGQPKQSLLISAINHNEFLKMPPKEKLSTRQVVDLTRWVKMGAPWPQSKNDPSSEITPAVNEPVAKDIGPLFTEEQKQYWAFQPPIARTPPEVRDNSWPKSPIDHFILHRLETAGQMPAPPATRRDLIRRASFDLIGLPPTADEIDAFLNDQSPHAFRRVIDRLLASPRYGERWGRHWLDVARYADSNGLDENLSYANAFRYRDYVISAFNRDKPYSRFVQEQIAGDLLPELADEKANLDRLVATGFLAIGPKMLAEDDPVKMQMDIVDEQVSTVGQAFLGLTLGCARCHDHKFDPIPTEDYYSLAGIFKSSKTMENHNVVAVWYERPLVTKHVSDELARIDKQLHEVKQRLAASQADARAQQRENLRRNLGAYLMATVAAPQWHRHSEAMKKQPEPFAVLGGYAVIEAEAFHRGNVEAVSTGYGEAIGIIATSGAGFAEYDVDVQHVGNYALEVRFAAAQSRPVSLLVNGERAADSILGDVTGTWYPDTQRWSATAVVHLNAGRNTIKFDSPRVYPHIDKLALVFSTDERWPFESTEPASLARTRMPAGANAALVPAWQDYFAKLKQDTPANHRVLRPWLALSQLDEGSFEKALVPIIAKLNSDADAGRHLPKAVKQGLAEASIRTLDDVAAVYQSLIDKIDVEFSKPADQVDAATRALLDPIRAEFDSDASPLSAHRPLIESALPLSTRVEHQQLAANINQLEQSRPAYDVAMGVTESNAEDLRIHLRGNHITLGKVAPRRFPRIIAGQDQSPLGTDRSGRLQLAAWMTRDDNPLLSRVMVNRIWRWRFGRGLVASVDNFGALGEKPSHPELLDWLAVEFLRSGGSIKAMHRLMMLSSTYQMSTRFDPSASETDPENVLLWRMNRRRLTGEEVRDTIHQLGRGLENTAGGSLLRVNNRAYVTSSGSNLTDEFDNHRRSVYLPVVRSSVYDVLQTLDFPDPAVSNGDRQTSTVAPQALMMMNSKLVTDSTRAIAERLSRQAELSARIQAAHETILGRPPTASESTQSLAFHQQALLIARSQNDEHAKTTALQSLCRVLMSSNEFVYVE